MSELAPRISLAALFCSFCKFVANEVLQLSHTTPCTVIKNRDYGGIINKGSGRRRKVWHDTLEAFRWRLPYPCGPPYLFLVFPASFHAFSTDPMVTVMHIPHQRNCVKKSNDFQTFSVLFSNPRQPRLECRSM